MTYQSKRVGDVAQFLPGFAFKADQFNADGVGLPVIRIRDVKRGWTETYYSGEYTQKFVIHDDDYLIGMDGEFNLGQWQGGKALLNQRVCKIESVSPEIDRDYLARYLSIALKVIEDATPFATVKHLSTKKLVTIEIPLPPITTQRRIAAELSHVNELQAKRRQSVALLDDLAESIFFESFGNLIENDRSWTRGRVADLVSGFETGKSIAEGDDENAPYRILKVSAITTGTFKGDESKPAPADYVPAASHFVRRGDLLFSRANTAELIGATAIVPALLYPLLMSDKIWRFAWRNPDDVQPLFVHYLFQQPVFRGMIQRNATGTSGSMKNISQEKVLTIPIGIPPVEAQAAFTSKVQALRELQERAKRQAAKLDELFAALQGRAFRNEL